MTDQGFSCELGLGLTAVRGLRDHLVAAPHRCRRRCCCRALGLPVRRPSAASSRTGVSSIAYPVSKGGSHSQHEVNLQHGPAL